MTEKDHLYDTEKKHEVRGLKTRGEAFERQMTLVVKYHEGTAARQRKVLKHYREKALELCPDLEKRVGNGRGRPFTPQGIQDRMDKLQDVEEAIDWSFDEEKQVFS
ncbi:hypothetical protein AKJ65_04575 [candidate division MSBL1 archaeon SCGC-AAA259E19]|uniref:Uncharacterized protein n=1 Tax=candidate division MSBL1 archaeon SCGC-AAA259E19 TaxID=1698264 RepID=A0A133UJI2_9EURY|nr:hypothetical protein AKJ65_04575 [candidate division MSBL1 archaeon SCGC-AAA259E19]